MHHVVKWRPLVLLSLLLTLAFSAAPAAAAEPSFADPAFQQVWQRYDKPVDDGVANRSWTWGPNTYFNGTEPYAQSPGGQRLVQYFDKNRMEINNPQGDRDDLFFVSNGLLARELISGRIALGDAQDQAEQREPALEAVAGDPAIVNAVAPTYASLREVASLANDNPAPNKIGQAVTATITKAGEVDSDADLGRYEVTYVQYDQNLKHNIPNVFWDFLNRQGPVWTGSAYQTQAIYQPWVYVTGLPLMESYWTRAMVQGVEQDVLVQCYERRCLTYTPSNDAPWRVEMGNVGQHYYRWRYGLSQPSPDTTAPVISGEERTTLTATTATIVWTTDEPATSEVQYGTSASYGRGASDDELETNHSITLTGLEPDTVYHWRAVSKDAAGNTSMSEDHTFRTPAENGTPVEIADEQRTDLTATTATITWTTNVAASSEVQYGTTTSYGESASSADLVTSHSVTLTDLDPDTVYYWRVVSRDEAGNTDVSEGHSFKTPAS
jgi:hypothetical protein